MPLLVRRFSLLNTNLRFKSASNSAYFEGKTGTREARVKSAKNLELLEIVPKKTKKIKKNEKILQVWT